jgi:hypothetical protein
MGVDKGYPRGITQVAFTYGRRQPGRTLSTTSTSQTAQRIPLKGALTRIDLEVVCVPAYCLKSDAFVSDFAYALVPTAYSADSIDVIGTKGRTIVLYDQLPVVEHKPHLNELVLSPVYFESLVNSPLDKRPFWAIMIA